AMTPAHDHRGNQAADARGKMYDEAAGEIQHTHVAEESAAPHPVRERHIDEHEPADGEHEIGREPHPVRYRARHQRHRDDRKRHRSEEHTSELQSRSDLVCRLLLEKKKTYFFTITIYIY